MGRTLHYAVGSGSRCNRHGMRGNNKPSVPVALTDEIGAVTCLDCQRLLARDERHGAAERLQAAAPALLAALVNLDTLIDFGAAEEGDTWEWPSDPSLMLRRFREARDAIAKAEGR